MDIRLRYGLGVLLLGVGNLAVGVTQLAVGDQPTVTIGLELLVGVLLTGFGAAVLNDPGRIDPEQISPRILRAVGWIGIVLGGAMVVWSGAVVISAI